MSRILYVATSDIHIKTFHVPYLDWLTDQGHTVDLAIENRGNFRFSSCDQYHYIDFPRVAFSRQHFKSLKQLRDVIENGNYQLVHCHTPIPSALCRLGARRWRRRGGKVLYTAHGFHFYRGGPVRQWLTYYPVERFLSTFTDGIITINQEDFEHAQKFASRQNVFLIPGIGIAQKFGEKLCESKVDIKKSFGFGADVFVMTYIAEFIHRKNHQFIVKAGKELAKRIPSLRILFVGKGVLLEEVKQLITASGLGNTIHCLGYRDDVQRIAHITDIAISSSRHEGLGLGLAEQMMCGIPVVASRDKGHAELVDHGVSGFLFPQGNVKDFIDSVTNLSSSPELRQGMGEKSRVKAQKFRIENSLLAMTKIYEKYLR
jgi:glycosyltransferase EpsD